MSENKIMEMTDAWLCSYKRALEKTHNATLAVQAAASVVMFLAGKPEAEPQPMTRTQSEAAMLMLGAIVGATDKRFSEAADADEAEEPE